MLSRAFIILIFVILSIDSFAQHDINLGLYFNNYQASSDFRENITRNPIGFGLLFLRNRSGSKFQYGLEIGVGLYSGKKYFYRTIDEGFPDNIEYLYEEDGFLSYQVISRYKISHSTKKIIPYLEAKIGASTFFSAIRAMQVSEVYEDKFRFHDTAFNAGIGAGSSFNVGRLIAKKNWKRELLLDLSATYMLGSDVTYRNSIKNELVESFESGFRNSNTSALHLKMGFIISF